MSLSSFAVLVSIQCIVSVYGKHMTQKLPQRGLFADERIRVNLGYREDCLGGFNAINPTVNFVPGSSDKLAIAMRALCLHHNGGHAIWLSSVIMGSSDASSILESKFSPVTWDTAPDPRSTGALNPAVECRIPELDDANGPEDPRLVETEVGLFLVFGGYAMVPSDGFNQTRPVCGPRGFLLHASQVLSVSPPKFGPAVQLTFEGMGRVEKNWGMFVSKDNVGANVHAIYSVFPHKVGTVDLTQGQVKWEHETWPELVYVLAERLNVSPKSFHGGAGIAHIMGDEEYYLSIMHVRVVIDGIERYLNYPYKFAVEPPFHVTRIGKKLPLKLKANPVYGGDLVAFVSTLLYSQDTIHVFYGSGDRQSRVLSAPLREFEEHFFP